MDRLKTFKLTKSSSSSLMKLGVLTIGLLVFFISLIEKCSGQVVIENGQISLLDSSGITSKSFKFSSQEKTKSDLKLEASDDSTLKLTFDINQSSKDQKSILPNQLSVLATGVDTDLHWVTVVKARSNGKAKWELDLARAPTDFLSLSSIGQILLELIVAGQESSKPLRLKLVELNIPKSLILSYPYWDTKDGKPPASSELEKYYVQPALLWTFQQPRKPDNPILSLAFMGIVLSPWLILLSTWPKLSRCSTPSFKLISSPSKATMIFITSILSQQALILTYWAKLKIYQYLPIAFVLSLPLILSGRSSLSELKSRRKRNPIRGTHLFLKSENVKGKQKGE